MPASPPGLRLEEASIPYLQTLTAYFVPAITAQIANVLCKRSWKTSLFSSDFLSPLHRREMLEALANWRSPHYTVSVKISYHLTAVSQFDAPKAFLALLLALALFPFKFLMMILSRLGVMLERPVIIPFTAWLSRLLERHYIILNLVSNSLIDLGIVSMLLLGYLFIYTPLSTIYFFAPVPWHVYLFAFHGTIILLVFEEVKKYYRRRGYPLEFLG